MKPNQNLILIRFFAILICAFALAFSVSAQKRKTTSRRTNSTISATTAGDVKTGAAKVSTQIKNVSKFVFLLGSIAQGIEDVDKDIKSGKVSRATVEQNTKNKQAVVDTIRNLRAGLAALEIEFRTKQGLKNYLFQIQGISDMSGVAEDQASAGQLTESGKTLLMVIEKLTDTLAALP